MVDRTRIFQAIAQSGADAEIIEDEEGNLCLAAKRPKYPSPKKNRFYLSQPSDQMSVDDMAVEIKRWWDNYDNYYQ